MCAFVYGLDRSSRKDWNTSLLNSTGFFEKLMDLVKGIRRHVEALHDVRDNFISRMSSHGCLPENSVKGFGQVQVQDSRRLFQDLSLTLEGT